MVRQQTAALSGYADMLLLTGAAPQEQFPFETRIIDGVGYDASDRIPQAPEKTADLILQAIYEKWPDGCDILHVHNPLLAKNQQFLKILSHLQRQGIRLLLQIHDFAEDGRPGAYYKNQDYPRDCHYCVINSRDERILLQSGLAREGLHLLPNMVEPFNLSPKKTIAQKFVLYPVRAIRRKNIGEAILLSVFFEPETALAITLPPNSPTDWTPYNGWKTFVAEKRLPVIFEASDKYNYLDLVKSADAMIMTSVTEGFGFNFLEPWTADQLLVGRRLPDICRDFEQNGIGLDHLYDHLFVPLASFDESTFFDKWQRCINVNARRYGVQLNHKTIRDAYQALTKNRLIDFGLLGETCQQQVIARIISDKDICKIILDNNPAILHPTNIPDRDERISENREAVISNYGQSTYIKRLVDIYGRVQKTDILQEIDKARLASEFLNPETFSLLKWYDNELF